MRPRVLCRFWRREAHLGFQKKGARNPDSIRHLERVSLRTLSSLDPVKPFSTCSL